MAESTSSSEQEDPNILPLHKYSGGPLNRILSKLSYCDIVEASLINHSVRNKISEARIIADSFIVSFDNLKPYIGVIYKEKEFKWCFYVPEGMELGNERRRVGRYKFDRSKRTEKAIYCDCFGVEHPLPAVFDHLLVVFDHQKAAMEELVIDLRVVMDVRGIIEKFSLFPEVRRLVLKNDEEEDSIDAWRFSGLLNIIFQRLRTVSEIYVGVNGMHEQSIRDEDGEVKMVRAPTRYPSLLEVEHICLVHAEWVTREDLINFKGKTAIIINHRLTEQDINAFINSWLNGNNDNLMWIEIRMPRGWNREVTLEGLTPKEDVQREKAFCCCKHRRFDGLPIPFKFPIRNSKIYSRIDGQEVLIAHTADTFMFHVKDDGPLVTMKMFRGKVRMLQTYFNNVVTNSETLLRVARRSLENAAVRNQPLAEFEERVARRRADYRALQERRSREWINIPTDDDSEEALTMNRHESKYRNVLFGVEFDPAQAN